MPAEIPVRGTTGCVHHHADMHRNQNVIPRAVGSVPGPAKCSTSNPGTIRPAPPPSTRACNPTGERRRGPRGPRKLAAGRRAIRLLAALERQFSGGCGILPYLLIGAVEWRDGSGSTRIPLWNSRHQPCHRFASEERAVLSHLAANARRVRSTRAGPSLDGWAQSAVRPRSSVIAHRNPS